MRYLKKMPNLKYLAPNNIKILTNEILKDLKND